MVFFCPYCCNVLLTEAGPTEQLRLYCKTCPYIFNIEATVSHKTKMVKKKVDDVLGSFTTGSQTEVRCECGNMKAYYLQMQTRSADEPMTIFYKCTACGNQWKEG